ncbi:MAG TPA: hypothetical protein VF075_03070 [Pyrinomonadaceae bacterium]
MSALILKSANHIYKIFKVYLAMAVCGALSVVFVATILTKPLTLLVAIGSISFLMVGILLWVQVRKFTVGPNLDARSLKTRKPPKLAESIIAIALPASKREVVIGDLREQFTNLEAKYGRISASSWYVLQTTLFFFNLTPIQKFHAKLERVVLQFALFILCIVAITKLIESTNVTQFLLRILR